ncbi:MAG: hypothetical protein D3916_18975 [Candidatus Electrothrix sp. MAN1_4]|nr:hypothetical protein [Candidatus Electrothrix sp. MAN1_4]
MDFITSAIASAVGSLGLEGVKHGYTRLKDLLQGKFGEKSALAEAVKQLERNPDSAARKAVVAEELAKVGADKDKEVLAAAKQLEEKLKGVQPQGTYLEQNRRVTAKGGGLAIGGNVEGGINMPSSKRCSSEEEEK